VIVLSVQNGCFIAFNAERWLQPSAGVGLHVRWLIAEWCRHRAEKSAMAVSIIINDIRVESWTFWVDRRWRTYKGGGTDSKPVARKYLASQHCCFM